MLRWYFCPFIMDLFFRFCFFLGGVYFVGNCFADMLNMPTQTQPSAGNDSQCDKADQKETQSLDYQV